MGKPSSRNDSASRAEQKFEKKLQFYTKVRDTVTTLNAQKSIIKKRRSRQKKLKAYDLSSLSEVLSELKPSQEKATADAKLNCKTRHNLVLKESNQLKTVMNHPTFQSDPLGAIYQHLQSTQPAADVKPRNKDGKSGKKKLKRKKSSSRVQFMEA